MSKAMSITIPDEIYGELAQASRESLRPLATEAVYRIKVGLGSGVISEGGFNPTIGTMEQPKKEVKKVYKEEPVVDRDEILKDLEDRGFVSKGFSKADQLNWKHVKK